MSPLALKEQVRENLREALEECDSELVYTTAQNVLNISESIRTIICRRWMLRAACCISLFFPCRTEKMWLQGFSRRIQMVTALCTDRKR